MLQVEVSRGNEAVMLAASGNRSAASNFDAVRTWTLATSVKHGQAKKKENVNVSLKTKYSTHSIVETHAAEIYYIYGRLIRTYVLNARFTRK